ncbi:hypothetical protein EL06_28635, partial [Salmonella enterica subsp. diarizonae]|nr:hypothetical protein [Salmonella enterica subsp. diarizonae]
RQTTRRRQPSRYGQRGLGVNGGSVKNCQQGESACAGCHYYSVVVTLWSSGVNKALPAKRV